MLESRVVVIPLKLQLQPHDAMFRWLDSVVPASYCMLRSLIADMFMEPVTVRPCQQELTRAYCNMIFELQNGQLDHRELPDWIMEHLDVVGHKTKASVDTVRELYDAEFGAPDPYANLEILPTPSYDIILRLTDPPMHHGRYRLPRSTTVPRISTFPLQGRYGRLHDILPRRAPGDVSAREDGAEPHP